MILLRSELRFSIESDFRHELVLRRAPFERGRSTRSDHQNSVYRLTSRISLHLCAMCFHSSYGPRVHTTIVIRRKVESPRSGSITTPLFDIEEFLTFESRRDAETQVRNVIQYQSLIFAAANRQILEHLSMRDSRFPTHPSSCFGSTGEQNDVLELRYIFLRWCVRLA